METIARGITYTDLMHAGRARIIATAVLQSAGGVALVDPGPSSCLDTLRASLADAGIGIGDIRKLLLTHIHLDHAGASGSLLGENPDIEVCVHERGAPHMIDPSEAAGQRRPPLRRRHGRALGDRSCPCPPTGCACSPAASASRPADRELEVAYTPGHASHHVSFFDRSSGIAFVGDVAGVRTGRGALRAAPTPPPDIDVETWADSIVLVRRCGPRRCWSPISAPTKTRMRISTPCEPHLAKMTEIARTVVEAGGSDAAQVEGFTEAMRAYMERHLPAAEADLYGIGGAPRTVLARPRPLLAEAGRHGPGREVAAASAQPARGRAHGRAPGR